jgi:MFS family permease
MSESIAVPVTSAAITLRIVATVFFTFIGYLSIGIPLAVLPQHVHAELGFSSVVAGVAISMQYLATVLSRPYAGRMSDTVGPRRTVLLGLAACGASGLLTLVSVWFAHVPGLSLAILLAGRLVLGCGESWVGTGAIAWAIGRVGAASTARVISWNGIATYGALAIGAPLGVALSHRFGFASVGAAVSLLAGLALPLAWRSPATAVPRGERLAFAAVFTKVLPYGIGLALGSSGFGAIATFVTLYFASRGWADAALTLTVFGATFVGARLVFADAIGRFGGFRTAVASFSVECAGLVLLGLAATPSVALLGAALTGLGFALVFPSLGVEAVALVSPSNRGAALGAYSVFLDLALGVTGPLAGLIASRFGYPEVFLAAAIAAASAVALVLWLSTRVGRLAGSAI